MAAHIEDRVTEANEVGHPVYLSLAPLAIQLLPSQSPQEHNLEYAAALRNGTAAQNVHSMNRWSGRAVYHRHSQIDVVRIDEHPPVAAPNQADIPT